MIVCDPNENTCSENLKTTRKIQLYKKKDNLDGNITYCNGHVFHSFWFWKFLVNWVKLLWLFLLLPECPNKSLLTNLPPFPSPVFFFFWIIRTILDYWCWELQWEKIPTYNQVQRADSPHLKRSQHSQKKKKKKYFSKNSTFVSLVCQRHTNAVSCHALGSGQDDLLGQFTFFFWSILVFFWSFWGACHLRNYWQLDRWFGPCAVSVFDLFWTNFSPFFFLKKTKLNCIKLLSYMHINRIYYSIKMTYLLMSLWDISCYTWHNTFTYTV